MRCPEEGGLVFCYDHTEVLTWRHLNVFQHRCGITCRLPRGKCRQCGNVFRVRPPWEGLSTHFTKEFEAFALLLMREMPMSKVAEAVGETDPRLWRMLFRQVDAADAQADFSNVCCVGVDERSVRKGPEYIYRSPTATTARPRFQVWCRWVRWAARFYKAGLLAAMVKLAQMIEHHLAGILAHWKWGVTHAFREGLNSVFSATKRKARGYRSTTHLITMLYFTAGKLRLPQF